jgi:hypothetical protein
MPSLLTNSGQYRDFLLGRNLPPPVPYEIQEGFLEGFYQDIGKVIGLPNPLVGEYVQFDEEGGLAIEAEDERDIQLGYNRYINRQETRQYEVITPNIDQTSLRQSPYNVQNFGLIYNNNEIGIPNPFTSVELQRTNDFESNLAIIGSEQLEFHINEKVSQNIKNETVDRVNTNPLSLLQGNEIFVPNYEITVEKNPIGKSVEFLGRLAGTSLPVSTLPKGTIGWQEFNSAQGGKTKQAIRKVLSKLGVTSELNLSTEKRMTELIARTSIGQKGLLFDALGKNTYIPDYSSPRLFGLLGDRAPTSRYYIGNESSTNRNFRVTVKFDSSAFGVDGTAGATTTPENFAWSKEYDDANGTIDFNEKTILSRTKQIQEDLYDGVVYIDQTAKFFKDSLAKKYISRGNAILSDNNNPESFARVWTKPASGRKIDEKTSGYSYKNAIRNSGLFTKQDGKPGFSVASEKASLSVLQENGMVKTHPILEDSLTTFKKFMVSIENLAWTDNLADLPLQEIGPGDAVSGNKGRIMWFAPYDLTFDESVTANWQATDFIGRGEPVYTYNNTKRSGQLKFKILVDHPRVINEYRGRQDNNIEKFFAGVIGPTEFLELVQKQKDLLDPATKSEIEIKLNSIVRQSRASNDTQRKELKIYFENGSSERPTETYNPEGRNDDYFGVVANGVTSEIGKILKERENATVTIKGYASKAGNDADNQNLSKERASSVETFLKTYGSKQKYKVSGVGSSSAVAGSNVNPDGPQAQVDRRVEVIVEYNPTNDNDIAEPNKQEDSPLDEIIGKDLDVVRDLFINEASYFDVIDEEFPNYFETISEKIKYFHPGFHSNTPEGLNTRLNFLHQCTRQGPSIYDKNDTIKPQNLAFGRPPVCILRLGDFFYSKILINNINFNYGATNGLPQWDLNPEGIGVQPMIVDVSMSIEILGGQSLRGPLNRLQNALSFNFYANTEMYDDRADTIKIEGGKGEIQDGIKLSQKREEAGINAENYSNKLKTELPIDQEATKEREEQIEKEETEKIQGKIEITSKKPTTVTFNAFNKENQSKLPSQLVTDDGENRMAVVLKLGSTGTEFVKQLTNESSISFDVLSFSELEPFATKASEATDTQTEIDNLFTEKSNETNQRKIKKLDKQITAKLEELSNLQEEAKAEIIAVASFSKDTNATAAQSFTLEWSEVDYTYTIS